MKNVVDKFTKLFNQVTKFPSKITVLVSCNVHDNV